MNENIEKAASGGDMLIWGATFGILITAVIALAIWSKIDEKRSR